MATMLNSIKYFGTKAAEQNISKPWEMSKNCKNHGKKYTMFLCYIAMSQ
jgi:hypothetical protein